MDPKKAGLIISQLQADRYLNAIEHIQDEILKLETQSDPSDKPTSKHRRRISTLSKIIEKIGEAASFGDEWEEGRQAKLAAINKLQKLLPQGNI